MKIKFTRLSARHYSSAATTRRGITLEVCGIGPSDPIPHDWLHYIVERELGLKEGFWGCVAAGAVLPNTKITSGHKPHHSEELTRSVLKQFRQQMSDAEILVGLILGILRSEKRENWSQVQRLIAGKREPISRPLPNREEWERISAAVQEAQREWDKLSVGASIELEWRESPRR
jgi:hypothetical protein